VTKPLLLEKKKKNALALVAACSSTTNQAHIALPRIYVRTVLQKDAKQRLQATEQKRNKTTAPQGNTGVVNWKLSTTARYSLVPRAILWYHVDPQLIVLAPHCRRR
jgi:hypothetical protein